MSGRPAFARYWWSAESRRWIVKFYGTDGRSFHRSYFDLEENAETEVGLYNKYYLFAHEHEYLGIDGLSETPLGQTIDLWEDITLIKRERGIPV